MSKQQIHDNLVILQYEAEQDRKRRLSLARHRPLSKALKYAGIVWGHSDRCVQHTNWYNYDWPIIVRLVCMKFGCNKKITDIDPDYLDQANAYAIELIDSWTPTPGRVDYQKRREERTRAYY